MNRIKEIAGPVQIMLRNVIYAMPGQTTVMYVELPDSKIDYSEDAINFSPVTFFQGHATFSAPYVRAPLFDVKVSFKGTFHNS